MDIEKFRAALVQLVEQYGGIIQSTPAITLDKPQEEQFICVEPHDRGLTVYDARRTVQPIHMVIELDFINPNKWMHSSGDNRKLHPDLNKGE